MKNLMKSTTLMIMTVLLGGTFYYTSKSYKLLDKALTNEKGPSKIEADAGKYYYYIGSNTGIAGLGNNGLKILFNSQDITIGYQLMSNNNWEPALSALMIKFVNPGDNIVDLGANYGTHTLRLAQKAYNGKNKVYAFEANPKVYNLLNRSVDLNGFHGNIKPYNLLITDQDGKKYTFTYSDEYNVGGSKITPTSDLSYVHNLDKFSELSSSKLDTIIPSGTKINFMKLDIEGSEFMAIAGASRVIEESIDDIIILMEWNYVLISNPIENIKSFAQKYGFNVWFVQGDSKPEKIEDFSTLSNRAGDLFLSRKTLDFNS